MKKVLKRSELFFRYLFLLHLNASRGSLSIRAPVCSQFKLFWGTRRPERYHNSLRKVLIAFIAFSTVVHTLFSPFCWTHLASRAGVSVYLT